jgi:protein-S-isoprenylcysteine O-methyltransferase Ste14
MDIFLFFIGIGIRMVALKQSKIQNFWRICPQELCTKGFYKIVRHPMYLGTLLTMFGFNWAIAGIRVAICMEYLVLIYVLDRIDREEQLLIFIHGEQYLDYARKTYMLIPFIF